ncbi:MAG: pseudouridine synthase [Neisseriaceae bacterium]|nr:MAG: pseudouridine synthase [Neisseriaceae bacterium]
MSNIPIILFNKPYGVVCQFSPHEKYPTLKDYIDIPNYYPAGRLDMDSEGLLMLTNDGRLQHQVSHPKFKQNKTYFAQLEGVPDTRKLKLLETEIHFKDFITQPAKFRLLETHEIAKIWPRVPPIRMRKSISDFWIAITLQEGKNRQVRKMTAHVGYPCLRLIRIQIGRINLFDINLSLGQYQLVSTLP